MAQIDRIRMAAQRCGWEFQPVDSWTKLVYHRTVKDEVETRQTLTIALTNHQPTPRVRYAWLTSHHDYPTGRVHQDGTANVDRILDMFAKEA